MSPRPVVESGWEAIIAMCCWEIPGTWGKPQEQAQLIIAVMAEQAEAAGEL